MLACTVYESSTILGSLYLTHVKLIEFFYLRKKVTFMLRKVALLRLKIFYNFLIDSIFNCNQYLLKNTVFYLKTSIELELRNVDNIYNRIVLTQFFRKLLSNLLAILLKCCFFKQHTKTFTYIANCLEKLNCSYDDIAKIYDKALESAAEANDDLLTVSNYDKKHCFCLFSFFFCFFQ